MSTPRAGRPSVGLLTGLILVVTVLVGGFSSSAAAGTLVTLTPVGTFASSGSSAQASSSCVTTLSTTFVNVGDLLVIWVQSKDTAGSIHVTGIAASGTGSIGTPSAAIAYNTVDHPNNTDEIWYASVTAAGSVTLTFSWSSSTTSVACEYAAQEFQPSAPATYSLDKATSLEVGTSSTTIQFPSLTPANSGEVYAGYNSNNTSGIYGSPTTAGYTVERGFISYD
ncbi:MAG: hypothetical protein ACYC0H_11255, partial [Solirubrobacteraceae bacterium]